MQHWQRIQPANGAHSKQTYRVRQGDSLWTIARKHGHRETGQPLEQAGCRGAHKAGPTTGYLQKGGKEFGKRVRTVDYTVRSGDSLYLISKKFNVSINDLRRWNNLSKGKYLQPGQNLKLYVDVTQLGGTVTVAILRSSA